MSEAEGPFRYFIDCIKDRKNPERGSLEDGIGSLELTLAAIRSGETGKVQKISLISSYQTTQKTPNR